MRKKILCSLLLTLNLFVLDAQQKTPMEERLDSIFLEWDQPKTAGVAAGLIQNGKTIYLKGFGTANLEYDIAITPQTKFQIDYLSKQFTTLALLILEQQGKIKWSDDIRKYIPQLPAYNHVINIAHVLNHSTGLDNYALVKSLLGKNDSNPFTHKNALDLISAQSVLNSKPGTSFSYMTSDTETSLMVEIISKASGKSFVDFTKEQIFDPLQMKNTLFCDDFEMLITNKAASYQTTEKGNKKNELSISTPGPTNLYISAEDLSIWHQQFYQKDAVFAALLQKLDTAAQLTNGTTYDSSWGRLTLGRAFYHLERGVPAYWQYGIIGGYAANAFRFPEQELTSFVIGNNMRYNGFPAMQAAELFIKDAFTEPQAIDFSKLKTQRLTEKKLKKHEGYYWNMKRGLGRKVELKQDSLRFSSLGSDNLRALVPLSNSKFQMVVQGDDRVILDFKEEGNTKIFEIAVGDSKASQYIAFTPTTYTH